MVGLWQSLVGCTYQMAGCLAVSEMQYSTAQPLAPLCDSRPAKAWSISTSRELGACDGGLDQEAVSKCCLGLLWLQLHNCLVRQLWILCWLVCLLACCIHAQIASYVSRMGRMVSY